MPLRSVLSGVDETLQEMYLAAEYRYREGVLLLERDEWDGGIYLLGYTAEMFLKLAYCRLDPAVALTDPVMSRLSVAEARWRRVYRGSVLAGAASRFDLHDPVMFLVALEDGRQHFGKAAFTNAQTRLLNAAVFSIYDNWWVAMRYRGRYATRQEAEQVREAVEWLRDNQRLLWS